LRDVKELAVEKIQRLSYPYSFEQLRQEYALLLGKEVNLLSERAEQLEKKN